MDGSPFVLRAMAGNDERLALWSISSNILMDVFLGRTPRTLEEASRWAAAGCVRRYRRRFRDIVAGPVRCQETIDGPELEEFFEPRSNAAIELVAREVEDLLFTLAEDETPLAHSLAAEVWELHEPLLRSAPDPVIRSVYPKLVEFHAAHAKLISLLQSAREPTALLQNRINQLHILGTLALWALDDARHAGVAAAAAAPSLTESPAAPLERAGSSAAVRTLPAPRLFISYSHDSPEHARRVLDLANRLRAEGVDAWIDQYELAPAQGWPRWMQQQIEQADFIVLVCTATYRRRFEGKEDPDRGKGVTWEGLLAQQVLYEAQTRNERLVPVLFDDEDEETSLPMILRPYMRYRLPGGYEGLYRRLTGQPAVIAPPVGPMRAMRPHDPPMAVGTASATPFGSGRDPLAVGPLATRSAGMPDRPDLASETPGHAPDACSPAPKEVVMKRDENVSRRAALEKLLVSLFDTDGLKRWLVLEYPDIQAELPSSRLSRASYVHEAVEMLVQHIDINREFFARLIAVRRGRVSDIHAVRDAWLAQEASSGVAPAMEPVRELISFPAVSAGDEPVVRILHLSDFHFRETTAWDAEPVLSRLAADIARVTGSGLAPDLIVITGDIAFSGKAEEYELAARWIRERLLPAAGAQPEQLFLVPGNHDADRALVDVVARDAAQGLLSESRQQNVAALLGSETGAVFLRRHQAFVEFVNYIGASGTPLRQPWHALTREIRGVRVHCAGFSSSWLASGDDRGRLLLGLWQCNELLRGADDADVVIAAMHHPWDYLAEWDQVSRAEIEHSASLVLRGHLHDVRHTFTQSTHHGGVLELAAGACYESSRWPNSYHLVELFPWTGQARIHPRHWDPHRRGWQPDYNLFHASYGEQPLALRRPRT